MDKSAERVTVNIRLGSATPHQAKAWRELWMKLIRQVHEEEKHGQHSAHD
jgi:hypothetical protein